jgi:capsular polysaccharide biosynthesis protein
MSQQVLDLRRSVQIVRRRKGLVAIVVALGLLAGGAYAAVYPPMLTSTALVVLPLAVQNAQAGGTPAQTTSTTESQYMATQVVIAHSDAVLSAALPNVRPATSLDKLRGEVQVGSPTSYIISISATSKVEADAEANANTVANSYITYINSPDSPIGQPQARMLEPATTATGTRPLEALIITGLIGAAAGVLVGIILVLAIGRKDKRLRERDEIANSIGVPVLASVPVSRPSDAAGWMKLLEGYKPGVVHAWRLRKALQQLGMTDTTAGHGDGSGSFSLAVLSVSSDTGALALGPQLAVFAASQGIPTTLLVGPQQDMNATATLRTACAVPPPALSKRPRQLRVAVHDGSDVYERLDSRLTVVVVVVDGRNPQMPNTLRTTATVIGVSAGSATAEQLARTAVVAAVDDREVAGILVANPDPTDQTTGRIPQLAPPSHRRRPTRIRGFATEIRR